MPKLVYVDRIVSLDGAEVVLGRHRDCTLQVDDEKASRRHARLLPDQGGWCIEDLESANGTTVNGRPFVGRRKLVHEDVIGIGKSRLQFHDEASAPAAPVREKRSAAAQGVAGNPDVLLGRSVGGCELKSVLGRSRLGATYRARQATLGRDVAVRIFAPEALGREGFAERLLAAVRKAAAVKHQYLMQIHEAGRDDELGGLWYSMELVDGDNLAELLERDGTLAPGVAGLVIERAAMALQALHEAGLVHGDLTPRNVMLTGNGQVKVGEHGLSEALAVGRGAAGDPAYRAPEGPRDARSDIYSLGCLFVTLLTGKPPYAGDTPEAMAKAHREATIPDLREDQPKLPAKLDELVHGMLAKNPEWRFGSIAEVLAELSPLRTELQMQAAPPKREPAARAADPTPRAIEPPPRRARGGGGGMLVWLAIIAVAGAVVWRLPAWRQREAPPADPAPVAVDPTTPTTPVADVPEPPADGEKPPADPNVEAWRTLQAQVDADAKSGDWGSAERALARFATTPGLSAGIAEAVRVAQTRLQVEGEAWYQAEVAKLPGDLAAALAQLDHLRDVVIASQRGDAEARYQEIQARLMQRLNAARSAARQAVESGATADLPALGAGLEAAFAGTPIAGLQRQFATACTEAAPAKRFWAGTWPATRTALTKAAGADALPAAAALLLAGQVAEAKRLLLDDPALRSGDLLRRREALLGREAAVLAFNDPADLQFIESGIGDLRFDGGALTGPAGDAVSFACTVPVGGADWEVSLVLHLADAPGAQAQATIAMVVGETPEAALRIAPDGMHARIHAADGWQQQQADRPATTPLKLRLACRDGLMQLIANGESVLEVMQARVPAGARLTIDVAGAAWKLDELQVVGGE